MGHRYAIVGCGGIANGSHLPAVERLNNIDLIAVCDLVEERAQAAAQKYGGEAFSNLDEMLSKAKPEIVDVCTNEPYHRPVVEKALEFGADVICEKTMADNVENAQAMLDAAERTGKRLAINYNYRWLASNMALRQMIQNGDFGDIRYVASTFHWFQGTHSVDMMRNLGGEIAELCATVTVDEDVEFMRFRDRVLRGNVRNAAVCVRYESGAIGSMTLSMYGNGNMNFEVVGTKLRGQVFGIGGELRVAPTMPGAEVTIPEHPEPQDWVGSFQRSIGAFVKSIEDNTPHPVTGIDGLKAMQIDNAINASHEQRGWVKPY
ncbi:Gfo/Idh/MocA family protein [Candidatus Poribacteria bacterium]